MREAFFYVRQVCRGRIEDGEIYSFCYKALCECARNFEPDWQRFFAYSKPNLRGNVSRYWKSLDTVKNSSMHETEVEAVEACSPISEDDSSWDVPQADADSGGLQKYTNLALEPDYVEPDFARIELRERLAMLKPIIEKKLNEQERMVIDLTYTGGYNFETIGKMLSPAVTRSAVQQTHARALKKLRNELARQKKLS